VGDPRCSGGTITSVVVVGPSFHQTGLACQNWSILGSDTAPKGYRYRDRELDDGTALSIAWKPGRLKIVLNGKGPTLLTSDLVPGDSILAVEVTFLTLGAPSNGYCVRCEPASGKDGSDGKTFLGNATTCAAPFACFSSPSGAFLD
jgi:hypothetical protein